MEGQPMRGLYHDLRIIAPCKAREVARKVLVHTNDNVTETARILGISRPTVRRARDGILDDCSRRPKTSPKKTSPDLECLIVTEAKRTHFRYRRLTGYLKNKYHLVFSEHTIRAILKRNQVKRRTKTTKAGSVRHLYDYEHLHPFTEFQLDTKHLLDQHALPSDVYDHMMARGLPSYEWHLMEMATRSRFTAYSYTLSATFGFLFITLVVLWLRTHNVRSPIRIQLDNGTEFVSGSQKKLIDWNRRFAYLNALLDPIPPGATHLQGVIENAHRADDEYFLMVHAERCNHTYAFLDRAQRWQDTWNFHRPSFGIAMHGKTPREKLVSSHTLIHDHVLSYPVVLMEDVFQMTGPPGLLLEEERGGKYVYTTCLVLHLIAS